MDLELHKICRNMGFLQTVFSQIPEKHCLQYEDEIRMITKKICSLFHSLTKEILYITKS